MPKETPTPTGPHVIRRRRPQLIPMSQLSLLAPSELVSAPVSDYVSDQAVTRSSTDELSDNMTSSAPPISSDQPYANPLPAQQEAASRGVSQ